MIKTKCYEMYNGNLLVSITCHCVYDLVTWRLETYFNLKICELERQKKKKGLNKNSSNALFKKNKNNPVKNWSSYICQNASSYTLCFMHFIVCTST